MAAAQKTTFSIERADHNPSSDAASPEISTTEAENWPSEPVTNASEYPQGLRFIWIVTSLILSVFLVSLDRTIIATAIPRITSQFHSLDQVGWYGSAFFLTLGSFQSTWGKGYKYFSMKPTFLFAIFVFEIGSLISGIAQNSTTLIVGRAVAGCGGAGIATGAYTLIALSCPPQRRPAYTGLIGATYGVASVVGPLLGGAFTENITWRWAFYINLPIGGISAAVILFTLKVPKTVQVSEVSLMEKILQMDLLGTFTIMAASLCYLLALQWGGVTKSWADKSVIGTLIGCGLLLILFGILEWYLGERALLQGRIVKSRIIIVGSAYVILLGGAFFTLVYYLPIYFQSVSGVSPLNSGLRNLGIIIAVSVCTISSGVMITIFGHYVPWMVAGSILASIGAGLIFILDIGSPSSQWIGFQILAGMGLGSGFQVPIIAGQASVDITDISSVTAILLFIQTIGGSFFVSAAQSVFANRLLSTLKANAPSVNAAKVLATGAADIRDVFAPDDIHGILISYLDGLHAVFALAIALAGLSLVVAIFAPWRRIDVIRSLKVPPEVLSRKE